MNLNKDPLLQMMDLTDKCMDQLSSLKLNLQIKLDSKKPSAPPPLPPPIPNFKPNQNTINFKSINGLSVGSGHALLNHVTIKNRPKTSFDVEIAATVKKRKAGMDKIGRPVSYWDALYAPPAKKRKTDFEIELKRAFMRRNDIEEMDQDE